jgi:hypothetical protein
VQHFRHRIRVAVLRRFPLRVDDVEEGIEAVSAARMHGHRRRLVHHLGITLERAGEQA